MCYKIIKSESLLQITDDFLLHFEYLLIQDVFTIAPFPLLVGCRMTSSAIIVVTLVAKSNMIANKNFFIILFDFYKVIKFFTFGNEFKRA